MIGTFESMDAMTWHLLKIREAMKRGDEEAVTKEWKRLADKTPLPDKDKIY